MAQQCEGTHQGRTKEIDRWWASNGSTLALKRFPVSESGDGGTSLGQGSQQSSSNPSKFMQV
jgi:hypothetical protein